MGRGVEFTSDADPSTSLLLTGEVVQPHDDCIVGGLVVVAGPEPRRSEPESAVHPLGPSGGRSYFKRGGNRPRPPSCLQQIETQSSAMTATFSIRVGRNSGDVKFINDQE